MYFFKKINFEICFYIFTYYLLICIQSGVMAGISRRRGLITNTETKGDMFILTSTVPLSQMFGYAAELRGITSGQGEFTMEYKGHQPVPPNEVELIAEKFRRKAKERQNEK